MASIQFRGRGSSAADSMARHESRPPGSPRSTVAVLAITGACAAFMQTLIIPIQAELPELLHEPREQTAWVVTATLLTAAIVTPVAGRLGDLYGKRRVVLSLLAVLFIGSTIAALSQGLGTLVVGRALQGSVIGVIPLGISIARERVPPDRLPGAIALISATLGVGGSLGLPISAVISEQFDWHVLFWMAAGLALTLFVLVARIVPPSLSRSPGTFDAIGALGLAAGLTGVLLAVSQGAGWGWASVPTMATGFGGLLILLAWGKFELRRSSPVVDLRVAARKPVLLTNLASIAMGFAMFSGNVAFPQLLELPEESGVGLGLPLLSASFVLMPAGLVMMAMSTVTGRLTRRFGARLLLAAGAGAIAVAYVLALVVPHHVPSLLAINLVIGLGVGLGYSAMPTLIMHAVPASETAAANGLNSLMRALGTSVAAAVVGAQLAAFSMPFGSATVPTADGFRAAFISGGVLALVGCALAIAIPKHRPRFDAEPALPDDVP